MERDHSNSISDCLGSGKKKALLIAVNMAKGLHELPRAQSDAEDLRRLLIGMFTFHLPLIPAR